MCNVVLLYISYFCKFMKANYKKLKFLVLSISHDFLCSNVRYFSVPPPNSRIIILFPRSDFSDEGHTKVDIL